MAIMKILKQWAPPALLDKARLGRIKQGLAGNAGEAYSLTPPRATPAIIYLDNKKYMINNGNTDIASAKYTEPYSVL